MMKISKNHFYRYLKATELSYIDYEYQQIKTFAIFFKISAKFD